MKRFLVPVLIALGLVVGSYHAVFSQTSTGQPQAEKEKEKEKPRTPEEQKTYDDFIEKTKEFTDKPFNDPTLEFKIRLPAAWEKLEVLNQGNSTLTRKILGIISHFSGPAIGDIRPQLIVEALELEHEITAENWARNFALTNGYTLKELVAKSEYDAYGAYITIENGVSVYTRFTAKIIGNIMVLARFNVPNFAAEKLDAYMKLSIESLAMAKAPGGAIENFKPFSMRDVMVFRFPLSWDLRPPRYDENERTIIELENRRKDGDKLNGLITVVSVRKDEDVAIESEVARIREDMMKTNSVTFEDMLFSRIPPSYLRFSYALQEAYKIPATKEHIAQEIWFTVYEDENWYVFIYLLTPSQEESFSDWARNTRALEMILRSIE